MSLKRVIFRHYILIASVGAAISVGIASWMNWLARPEIVGGIVVTFLGFIHFVQRQKLEETRLFHEIFTALNRRYDKLNEALELFSKNQNMCGPGREKVIDYLNLCAEEYLYFQEDYIYPEVWASWCRGMLQYLESRDMVIRQVWDVEVETGSYYGLTLEAIRDGAKLGQRVSTRVREVSM